MIGRPLLLVGLAAFFAICANGADYDPPRTRAGRPLLQGVWSNSSLTRLTRPRSVAQLVLSPEEAAERASGHFHNVRAGKDQLPSDPNKSAPEVLKSLPPVGNYNAFWVDPGSTYGEVEGELRSSWIVNPANGQIPMQQEAKERIGESFRSRPDLAGPEVLSLGERCLLGFGGSAGPPMLNVLYNNFYEIVQTPDHVVILAEMVHDARVIRLDAKHGPTADRRWLGDSVGHWNGDTLVVETRHFHPARAFSGPLYYSQEATVTERFTLTSETRIHYEFTVEDARNYTQVIRGEMSLNRVDSKVYEYACHEGNYAMGNMLRGARLREQDEE